VDGYRATLAERAVDAKWREFSTSCLARPEDELCVHRAANPRITFITSSARNSCSR
jgi:hypothetical protein